MTARYRLRCVGGGEIVPDPAAQSCPNGHDSLLRTEYRTRRLRLAPHTGIFRYLCWLPVNRPLLPSGGAVTYRSTGLSRELGLSRLFISFSGILARTGSNSCHRFVQGARSACHHAAARRIRREDPGDRLGGKHRAGLCRDLGAVPPARWSLSSRKPQVSRLWTAVPARDLFVVAVKGDYTDAISVANALTAVPGCVPEGGAKERGPARRHGNRDARCGSDHRQDARTIISRPWGAARGQSLHGRLPCGSRATGGLARYCPGSTAPRTNRLSLWFQHGSSAGVAIDPELDMPDASNAVQAVMSPVLTNRQPPYAIAGGLYDALEATKGEMYAVSNTAGRVAEKTHPGNGRDRPRPGGCGCYRGAYTGGRVRIHRSGRYNCPQYHRRGIRADPGRLYAVPARTGGMCGGRRFP